MHRPNQLSWLMELVRYARLVWHDERGVLSFEWILLISVVAIGVVGGLSAVRDAVISELGDVTGAIMSVDQSYSGFGTSFNDPPPPAGFQFNRR